MADLVCSITRDELTAALLEWLKNVDVASSPARATFVSVLVNARAEPPLEHLALEISALLWEILARHKVSIDITRIADDEPRHLLVTPPE